MWNIKRKVRKKCFFVIVIIVINTEECEEQQLRSGDGGIMSQKYSWFMGIGQNTNIKRNMEEVGSNSHRRIGGVQDFSGENS